MGTSYIKYKFDDIIGCSNRLSEIIDAATTVINELNALADGVVSSWDGPSQKAFAERKAALEKGLDQILDELVTDKKKIDNAVTEMMNTEEEIINDTSYLTSTSVF